MGVERRFAKWCEASDTPITPAEQYHKEIKIMALINYEKYQAELLELRRHFHSRPELSLMEYETADYIEKYLLSLGIKPQRMGECGISALVTPSTQEQGNYKTVAVRAEMDAIAVQEENDVPWKSQKDGVMHACGHDAILATALILAKLCVEHRDDLSINIKFLFQPAEENGRGTKILLDAGAMNDPDVDYFVMFHYVNDAPAGVELHRGTSSAAIGSMRFEIHGKSSHWSTPELGKDAISTAGEIIQALQEVNTSYESESPFIAGIGTIHGGTSVNIVADKAVLEGTLRACRMDDYQQLRKILLRKIRQISEKNKVHIETFIDGNPVPPIINDGQLLNVGLQAGHKVFGTDCRLMETEYLSGDSAAYFFNYAKGLFFIFTAEKPGQPAFPLHNGKFDMDESVMWKAVAVLHHFIEQLNEIYDDEV